MSLYLGTNLISGVATPIEGARNIGQIVQSTIPLTDAGLHLLDGALISGSGSYADFVTYIAGLVSTYPDIFTTEANWQTAVTTYGVCGKFVYDSTNQTVRLPKYGDKIYSSDIASVASVKGDGKVLGLTNGTTNYGLKNSVSGNNQALGGAASIYGASLGSGSWQGADSNIGNLGITLDASNSGIIADLSNITTALDGYWYIVIATSTKTDIEVDIDEIATDLNCKADVDLSNCTKPHIVETYNNGTSWYRVYSDGWCEQGGGDITTSGNVNFLKPFINTNYCLVGSIGYGVNSNTWEHYDLQKTSTDYFYQNCCFDGYRLVSWYACGYIS